MGRGYHGAEQGWRAVDFDYHGVISGSDHSLDSSGDNVNAAQRRIRAGELTELIHYDGSG